MEKFTKILQKCKKSASDRKTKLVYLTALLAHQFIFHLIIKSVKKYLVRSEYKKVNLVLRLFNLAEVSIRQILSGF
jgi:hypothetical protein